MSSSAWRRLSICRIAGWHPAGRPLIPKTEVERTRHPSRIAGARRSRRFTVGMVWCVFELLSRWTLKRPEGRAPCARRDSISVFGLIRKPLGSPTTCRLPIGDTAECHSALPQPHARRPNTWPVPFLKPKTEFGRDGALRRHCAVQARNTFGQIEHSGSIRSARCTRAGTAQRAIPTVKS
jgi:hypothetical protein